MPKATPARTVSPFLSTGRMLLSSIGNGEYLGRGCAGFRDQGEDTGKVASLAKNDDHVHMRRCVHRFGIEAEVSHTS